MLHKQYDLNKNNFIYYFRNYIIIILSSFSSVHYVYSRPHVGTQIIRLRRIRPHAPRTIRDQSSKIIEVARRDFHTD